MIFFLSNGDHYIHLKPLDKYLQSHLKNRNGFAHDGGFLDSFVPNPNHKSSSSSNSSAAFAKSVKTFMKDIANNGFDTKLKNGDYLKINDTSWTNLPVVDKNDFPKIYTELIQKVGKLY